MWDGQVELMREWQKTALSEKQFSDILADTICKKGGASQDNGHGKPVNERRLSYLIHRFREELPELGATKWAAYNALTHWSTHTKTEWENDEGKTYQTGRENANVYTVQRQRSDAVRTVIDSPAWELVGLRLKWNPCTLSIGL